MCKGAGLCRCTEALLCLFYKHANKKLQSSPVGRMGRPVARAHVVRAAGFFLLPFFIFTLLLFLLAFYPGAPGIPSACIPFGPGTGFSALHFLPFAAG